MPFLPTDYVTMLSILLAFLHLTVSTRAFKISVPSFVILNEPASATWTRSERDQGDFVFVLRSLQSGESERLLDVPNNLPSGTISLNFTHPGCYGVEIGRFNTEFTAIISSPVLVLEVGGNPYIPCSPPPNTAPSSTTSNPATRKTSHHTASSSAYPASDSSLSSSPPASSSSTTLSTDTHSPSSGVSPTSRYGTIPSSGTLTSSSSDALFTASQSISVNSSSTSGAVSVSSSITSSSSPILAHSQSKSISPSFTTVSVGVSSTATSSSPASTSIFTDSQSVSNSSSATSSPLPSISISSPLNSNATDSDGLATTSFTGLSSTSQQLLQLSLTSTIDITAPSTSIATSRTDDFTSGTSSGAPSNQVTNAPSSTTVSSDPSRGVTSELPSHSFPFEPSPNGATGRTVLSTIIPSSTSVLQPTSTSFRSDSGEETRLPKVLGGVFAALSILLVILGLVLYRRHRRLKTRNHDIEARENFNRRSGSLLSRPTMARTQTLQSFSSAHISSRGSSINSIDEIVRLLDPSGHATGPDYASATTHESHESDDLTRRESSDIASEHSYHSLTSNPFLDPPEGPLLPELPRPNAVKRKSSVVQSPARSRTQRSNGTTDSGTSRKTSRPESYFFMFVDGVMEPLDSRSDRYHSLVLSSECSFLMPDQIVLQERADALREDIVWLRRKVSSLPSDKRENEELLSTIRMREEDLKRLDREIEGEEKQRQSDDFPHFSTDNMVMDYSRISG
ncbi:hypothetical protein IW262DRAFT_16536 [Armillaria fumosa]|nr:hypothetical protein IW262DRAFT_16536 [Armillaria fumosa]